MSGVCNKNSNITLRDINTKKNLKIRFLHVTHEVQNLPLNF